MGEPLSVWSLVLEASLLVQLVMLSLMLASIFSWSMILQRVSVFRRAHRDLLAF